ncbi:hypothetical protein GF337_04605 [candidate division KSB1 bacterium]|nr:hypothetical protein [candidate division KSB1 bacterium]
MSSNTKYYGICITCNNAPTCRLSRDAERPVWFCEMFNDYDPPAQQSPHTAPSEKYTADDIIQSVKNSDPKYKGLCSNCARRERCNYPKPDGGVWHCAEYC